VNRAGQVGGVIDEVQVSGGIEKALDTDWADEGNGAGTALAAAACPADALPSAVSDSDVASQALALVASKRQLKHTWVPQSGIATALAQIVACHIGDVYADSPSEDIADPVKLDWTDTPVSGEASIDNGGVAHLGVNAAVWGTVIQAVAGSSANIATVVSAWSDYLPSYLTAQTPTDQKSMVEFYASRSSSPTGVAVTRAAGTLALIVENAMAGVPGGAQSAAATAIASASDASFNSVYPTSLNVLATAGYFSPSVVADVDRANGSAHIPDPTQPIVSDDGSGKVYEAPLTQEPDGEWSFDTNSAGGKQWLRESRIVDLSSAAMVSPTNNLDMRYVVSLP
jgi:hypothetical protein